MKQTKYFLNGGLAFSEKKDLNKLAKYAKQGWLLDGFSAGGLLFKLKKAEPQEIEYSLDYQDNVDQEYYSLFETSGWSHVLTFENMHFFCAPKGTKPIYSDKETIIDKYTRMRNLFRKYTIFSLLITLILLIPLMMVDGGVLFLSLLIVFLIATVILVFTGLPYMGYAFRLRKLR